MTGVAWVLFAALAWHAAGDANPNVNENAKAGAKDRAEDRVRKGPTSYPGSVDANTVPQETPGPGRAGSDNRTGATTTTPSPTTLP